MTGFLKSVKADLLDRRLLPYLIALGVALAAALAYAVVGGGSSTGAIPTATPATAPVPPGGSGISISPSGTSGNQPVAETTSGSALQRGRGGPLYNPFAPLPGAKPATVPNAKSSSSSKTASSGSSSTSAPPSSHGAGGTTPTAPKPSQPTKPTPPARVYHVAVLFGVVPAGTPPQSSQLTPYENLKRLTPLPSAHQPLVVFRGVTSGGKSATFTLVGEAILHGSATCVPSASQCQAIELKPRQAEQLEYLAPSGQTITYQLQVVSISSSKASTASAQRAFRGESKVGRELLRRAGLLTLPGLRYSRRKGVLVLAGHPAFGVRAHASARRERHER
jgi:hypothetical protein